MCAPASRLVSCLRPREAVSICSLTGDNDEKRRRSLWTVEGTVYPIGISYDPGDGEAAGPELRYDLPMIPPIPGADRVAAWFGLWPSFHDAEILSLHLNQGTPSLIRIHTWNLSDKKDRRGDFIRERAAIVVFEFAAMRSLHMEAEDADRKNPIQGLSVEEMGKGYRLRLFPCHGLCGEIVAQQLAVRLEAGI